MTAQIDQWIAAYGRAWEERDADAAAALFSDDAVYRDHPLGPPHQGSDGVRDYWTGVTATQAGVQVRFGAPVVSSDGRRAAVEFWVTMTNGGSDVTLTGIIVARFADDGRCEELREAWHFELGRLDPPAGWGLRVPMPESDSAREAVYIEARGVSKHFGGTKALIDATVAVRPGSVHALVGENGAGKSTLGKILSGVIAPDSGQLLVRGEPVSLRSPREALEHGIAAIGQEPSVVPQLSVAENVFLGAEPRAFGMVRRRALRRRYESIIRSTGFDLDGDIPARSLRVAEQQEVEILRALARAAEVVVMDEPTAALSGAETARLHEVVRSLAAQGKAILLISHFLREVLELADTVTVLRDGRVIRTAPAAEETEASLVEAMLGRPLASTFPPKRPPPADAPVVLAVKCLSAPGLADIDLTVRAGEIVGLAGLVGAGRSELAQAVFGVTAAERGTVELNASALSGGPRQRLRAGVALIPESRKDLGLILDRPIFENASLASLRRLSRLGLVGRRRERAVTEEILTRCDVRSRSNRLPVRELSGGNQQKVLLARTLLCEPVLVIADEPTRGVDVGAKFAIYELLVGLAEDGLGVLLISSELEEVMGLAHRVAVMRAGRIVAEFAGGELDETAILAAAFGNLPGKAA